MSAAVCNFKSFCFMKKGFILGFSSPTSIFTLLGLAVDSFGLVAFAGDFSNFNGDCFSALIFNGDFFAAGDFFDLLLSLELDAFFADVVDLAGVFLAGVFLAGVFWVGLFLAGVCFGVSVFVDLSFSLSFSGDETSSFTTMVADLRFDGGDLLEMTESKC